MYLCGVFCLTCVVIFLICLGGDGKIGLEEAAMFGIVITWPVSLPAMIIRFIIRARRWKARNS